MQVAVVPNIMNHAVCAINNANLCMQRPCKRNECHDFADHPSVTGISGFRGAFHVLKELFHVLGCFFHANSPSTIFSQQ
jgi:hypothetical protein